MSIVKEKPSDPDLFFDPRPYTKEEEKMISDYIRASKAKAAKQKTTTKKKKSSK